MKKIVLLWLLVSVCGLFLHTPCFADTRQHFEFSETHSPYPRWVAPRGKHKLILTKNSVILQRDWSFLVYWGLRLDPGRDYIVTFQGKGGPLEVQVDRFSTVIEKLDGTVRLRLSLPPDSRDNVLFSMRRSRGSKENVELSSVHFDAVPFRDGIERPSRGQLQKLRPEPAHIRGISTDTSLTEKDAVLLFDRGVRLVRLFFHGTGELETVKRNLDAVRKAGLKATIEYWPPEKESVSADRIVAVWRKVLEQIPPGDPGIYAWGIAGGKHVSVGDPAYRTLLRSLRELLPNRWLIADIGGVEDLKKALPLNDLRIIYHVAVKSPEEVTAAYLFYNVHQAPLLATLLDSAAAWPADDHMISWSVPWNGSAEQTTAAIRRPLHRSREREYQLRSLYDAAAKNRTPGSLNFIFATDSHFLKHADPNGYGADSVDHIRELAHIAGTLKLDFAAHGGDIISGREKGKKETLAELAEILQALQSSGIRTAVSIGNHDNNVAYDGTPANTISDREWFELATRPALERGAVGDDSRTDANYFYYDFPDQKIRVVVLATLENPMKTYPDGKLDFGINAWDLSAHQLQWLADKALSFAGKEKPAEWSVLFLSHQFPNESFPNYHLWQGVIRAFQLGGRYESRSENRRDKIKSSCYYPGRVRCDFTRQGPGRILAMVHGHYHRDMYSYRNGYLNIGFWCDLRGGGSFKHSHRVGTPDAMSLALISVDPHKNELRVLRYGRGQDLVCPLTRPGGPITPAPLADERPDCAPSGSEERIPPLRPDAPGLRLSPDAAWEKEGAFDILRVSCGSPSVRTNGANLEIDLEGHEGETLRVSGMCRGENIGSGGKPWNGMKFQLSWNSGGKPVYAGSSLPRGTFDWRPVSVCLKKIPSGLGKATLTMGVQGTTGTARYREIRVEFSGKPVQTKKEGKSEEGFGFFPLDPAPGVSAESDSSAAATPFRPDTPGLRLSPDSAWEKEGGIDILRVSCGSPSVRTNGANLEIDLEGHEGETLRVSGMCRGENIGSGGKPWNGMKFQLSWNSGGKPVYSGSSLPRGTFDWRPVSLCLKKIPSGLRRATLTMGVQGTTGTARYREIRVEFSGKPVVNGTEKRSSAPLRSGRLPLDLPELRAAVAAGLGISLEGEAITFENARPDRNLTLELPILSEKIRCSGGRLTISGEARLEQVTVGERSYFCAKLQPCLVQKDGKVIYATLLPTEKGSRDWFHFRRSCIVPPGVTKATLMLGLQNCTGKLQYRNLVIEEEAD